jgi:hypothetical protein
MVKASVILRARFFNPSRGDGGIAIILLRLARSDQLSNKPANH